MKNLLKIILFRCVGYSNVKYPPIDSEQREPTQSIDIYSCPKNVDKQYKEIGLITSDDEGWGNNETGQLKQLKKKALEIGVDAIIVQNSEQNNLGLISVGGIYYLSTSHISTAIAIVYIN